MDCQERRDDGCDLCPPANPVRVEVACVGHDVGRDWQAKEEWVDEVEGRKGIDSDDTGHNTGW